MPLRNQTTVSFLATENATRSRDFFENVIGLEFIEETQFALVFSTGNSQLRIQKVDQLYSPPYTSMGWQVGEIETVVSNLVARGVFFEMLSGIDQDDNGIWTSPSGAKIAWFKDPDGNMLSLTQVTNQ